MPKDNATVADVCTEANELRICALKDIQNRSWNDEESPDSDDEICDDRHSIQRGQKYEIYL